LRALSDEGTTMRRATTVLLSVAAVALVAACGTDGRAHPTGATAPTTYAATTEAPVDDPTGTVPPFPATTALQFAKPSGKWGPVFTDVRVAEHEGFDRIVLRFTGTGIPGWTVSYVDEARREGSGEAVRLAGDAFLAIFASHTTWPAAHYYSGPERFEPANGGDIDDLYVGGTFEGSTHVLAGIDGGPVPFRVFALADPSRLVVDVVDDSAD
jgi:hypothetical protein